ncbi:MAG: hypothetical protein QOF49_989, partial [Chloroflexota bacterium]|nr:hypothetical protein [Chloroflexota bacterium]
MTATDGPSTVDAEPAMSAAAILDARRAHLGPSLSLSYRSPL